jgi:hypothetical protein
VSSVLANNCSSQLLLLLLLLLLPACLFSLQSQKLSSTRHCKCVPYQPLLVAG